MALTLTKLRIYDIGQIYVRYIVQQWISNYWRNDIRKQKGNVKQCETKKRENSDVISDAYRRRYRFMKCTDKKLQKGLYRKPRLIAVY